MTIESAIKAKELLNLSENAGQVLEFLNNAKLPYFVSEVETGRSSASSQSLSKPLVYDLIKALKAIQESYLNQLKTLT